MGEVIWCSHITLASHFYDWSFILFRIGEVIDEDVLHARVPFVARTQQCFAVKNGIDGLLDIARRSFCDTSEGSLFSSYIPLCQFHFLCALHIWKWIPLLTAIHSLATQYREEFKLPNLKLPFNNRRGFYFSIPQKDIHGKLPSKFIQVMFILLYFLGNMSFNVIWNLSLLDFIKSGHEAREQHSLLHSWTCFGE